MKTFKMVQKVLAFNKRQMVFKEVIQTRVTDTEFDKFLDNL